MEHEVLANNRLLNLCGRHSMEIYVLHAFVQLLSRETLVFLGITNFCLNILINLAVTIFLIVVCVFFMKMLHLYNIFFKPVFFLKDSKNLWVDKGL